MASIRTEHRCRSVEMQAAQSEAEQAKALGMAQQEMEYRVDLFNRCIGSRKWRRACV